MKIDDMWAFLIVCSGCLVEQSRWTSLGTALAIGDYMAW